MHTSYFVDNLKMRSEPDDGFRKEKEKYLKHSRERFFFQRTIRNLNETMHPF